MTRNWPESWTCPLKRTTGLSSLPGLICFNGLGLSVVYRSCAERHDGARHTAATSAASRYFMGAFRLPAERTFVRGRQRARHRRIRVILRGALDRLGNVVARQQLDQLERLVETGRDPAAGHAVAVDDETWMALDDLDLGKLLEARNEGPMRRRLISVEQAGGGKQERAFADRRHEAGVL